MEAVSLTTFSKDYSFHRPTVAESRTPRLEFALARDFNWAVNRKRRGPSLEFRAENESEDHVSQHPQCKKAGTRHSRPNGEVASARHPSPTPDKKEAAFRRLFSDLGAGLFGEASTTESGGTDQS
jgi:hypothetical protein